MGAMGHLLISNIGRHRDGLMARMRGKAPFLEQTRYSEYKAA
jgi:hypothetical protein